MKPFDLQKALAGEKVVTREGKEVTDLHYFKGVKTDFKLFGVVDGCDVGSWNDTGQYLPTRLTAVTDLFMATATVERWVNAYKDGNSIRVKSYTYDTKEEAIALSGSLDNYLGTLPITIEL